MNNNEVTRLPFSAQHCASSLLSRLIETWDVLKFKLSKDEELAMQINRNMGCIEIISIPFSSQTGYGLIETWDVLKCPALPKASDTLSINRNMGCIEIIEGITCICQRNQINRNMGCIEIFLPARYNHLSLVINRNMGCIEMPERNEFDQLEKGLIETWDVLK